MKSSLLLMTSFVLTDNAWLFLVKLSRTIFDFFEILMIVGGTFGTIHFLSKYLFDPLRLLKFRKLNLLVFLSLLSIGIFATCQKRVVVIPGTNKALLNKNNSIFGRHFRNNDWKGQL